MASHRSVSIVVDCYNHERFVKATIESALAQDHDPVQVIVIDDGSPDRSPDIIRGFGDRIEAIFQDNQGQVAACRHALTRVKHDIVIFLDSDDLLDPDAARSVAAAWRDGVSKVQYCLKVIDENGRHDGNVFPKFGDRLTPETVRAEMLRTGSYPDSPTSGNAFDRRFLEEVLPLLPRRNGFDGELNGVAPLYGDVLSINRPLGSYRIHGDNDFAQRRLDVDRFEAYLRHSEARVAFIREHYRKRSQTIAFDVLDRDLKYLEYALVVAKLGTDAGSHQPEGPGRVASLAVKAAWQAPYSLSQRLMRIAWIVALVLTPKPLAAFLTEQRFIPARRLGALTWLATFRLRQGPSSAATDPLDRARGYSAQNRASTRA